MGQVILSISALLSGMALIFLGHGMLGTLLPLRMGMAEFPPFVVGMVMSAYFVGTVFGVFLGGRLIANVGHIRTFAALASIISAAAVAHPFLVAPLPWGMLRLVHGFCLAGILMCTESWLNERVTNEIRGRVFSFYMISIYLAQGGGQFLLNLEGDSQFTLFIIASILFSLALVPVAITRVQAPAPIKPSRLRLKELYATSPLGISGAFASGVILGGFYGLAPYFAQQTGLGFDGAAKFMAAAIVGGLLLQWPMGRLSDRFDRRTVFGGLALAACVTSVAFFILPEGEQAPLLVLAAVFGGTLFTLYPLCVAHTNDHIERGDLVRASGGLIVTYGIGAAIGPVATAGLISLVGPFGLFIFIAAVALAIASFTFWRMGQRPAPTAEQQAPFQPVPRTTPVASQLDPRSESGEPGFEFESSEPDRPA
ncbi:MAG: MFS transporter [Rhodospirillales bacterium]|jgi:MFS family permease|nr:MFS transporter [Rhodospirillales bacterium]MDP6883402.1 MFS transporter [Rhodospirillales bacterium]